MKASVKSAASLTSSLAAAVFYLINIVLSSLTLIGYLLHLGYLFVGRQPGVSITAQGPLAARWTQHRLSVREDEAANRLMVSLLGFFP